MSQEATIEMLFPHIRGEISNMAYALEAMKNGDYPLYRSYLSTSEQYRAVAEDTADLLGLDIADAYSEFRNSVFAEGAFEAYPSQQ